MPIDLVNKRTRGRISYERGSDALYLNGERVLFNSRQQKEVIWMFLSNVSVNVTHNRISDYLVSSGRGSVNDPPNAISGRFMHELNRVLEGIPELKGLIESVRGIGYRLCQDWIAPEPNIAVERTTNFLAALDNVVADCISHVVSCRVITRPNGLQYLDFDRSFAIEKYQILDKLLWDTIEILSAQAKSSDLIEIKASFQDISSYVLYWRFGDGLSEEKWKSDYLEEISLKQRRIKSQIEDVLKGSS